MTRPRKALYGESEAEQHANTLVRIVSGCRCAVPACDNTASAATVSSMGWADPVCEAHAERNEALRYKVIRP